MTNYTTMRQGGQEGARKEDTITIVRIIRKYANQPHQNRPNNCREVRKTILPFISKLKNVHIQTGTMMT
jgi:hypothetical protein